MTYFPPVQLSAQTLPAVQPNLEKEFTLFHAELENLERAALMFGAEEQSVHHMRNLLLVQEKAVLENLKAENSSSVINSWHATAQKVMETYHTFIRASAQNIKSHCNDIATAYGQIAGTVIGQIDYLSTQNRLQTELVTAIRVGLSLNHTSDIPKLSEKLLGEEKAFRRLLRSYTALKIGAIKQQLDSINPLFHDVLAGQNMLSLLVSSYPVMVALQVQKNFSEFSSQHMKIILAETELRKAFFLHARQLDIGFLSPTSDIKTLVAQFISAQDNLAQCRKTFEKDLFDPGPPIIPYYFKEILAALAPFTYKQSEDDPIAAH